MFADYLMEAITAAKELGYSKEVIHSLALAETESEIYRIMLNARKGMKYE